MSNTSLCQIIGGANNQIKFGSAEWLNTQINDWFEETNHDGVDVRVSEALYGGNGELRYLGEEIARLRFLRDGDYRNVVRFVHEVISADYPERNGLKYAIVVRLENSKSLACTLEWGKSLVTREPEEHKCTNSYTTSSFWLKENEIGWGNVPGQCDQMGIYTSAGVAALVMGVSVILDPLVIPKQWDEEKRRLVIEAYANAYTRLRSALITINRLAWPIDMVSSFDIGLGELALDSDVAGFTVLGPKCRMYAAKNDPNFEEKMKYLLGASQEKKLMDGNCWPIFIAPDCSYCKVWLELPTLSNKLPLHGQAFQGTVAFKQINVTPFGQKL